MSASLDFRFDNSYARDLEGLYARCQPDTVTAPRLLFLNRPLADELGLDAVPLAGEEGVAVLAGNAVPAGAEPLAQAYAGHQFGHFSPQLGDGRALLLGEVIDARGHRRDIAFKGSGRTPFSRGGDGKAAVGPMLREALMGEAMHALGIPSTRALAVVATGESVYRERVLPGAVLTRVAASHLRVGTFEFLSSRGDGKALRRLADYAIARHDPDLRDAPERDLALLRRVVARQAELMAQWMNVGFIHGVMNTDNMAISGETIDYGPCAFLEAYDPDTVFSSIDERGRYAYGNQPAIARWNLARLAEALLPLIVADPSEAAVREGVAQATEVLDDFPAQYEAALLRGQRAKLGLQLARPEDETGDRALVQDWLDLLRRQQVDFTLAWRRLADAADGDPSGLQALMSEPDALTDWLVRWQARCASEPVSAAERADAMRRVNPFVIPRNHQVEAALTAAFERDDLEPFNRLLAALARPFDETPDNAVFGQPAPAQVTACYRTFCGT